jgi:hypothetical protein
MQRTSEYPVLGEHIASLDPGHPNEAAYHCSARRLGEDARDLPQTFSGPPC